MLLQNLSSATTQSLSAVAIAPQNKVFCSAALLQKCAINFTSDSILLLFILSSSFILVFCGESQVVIRRYAIISPYFIVYHHFRFDIVTSLY